MRILYRKGNREQAWGISFDYAEFDDAQVDAALVTGWVRNPLELKKQEPESESDSEPKSEFERDADDDALQQQDPISEPAHEQTDAQEPEQESDQSLGSQEQVSDAGSTVKLSADEAKAYLDSIGVSYDGMHWKKVVALAEQHMKGE